MKTNLIPHANDNADGETWIVFEWVELFLCQSF